VNHRGEERRVTTTEEVSGITAQRALAEEVQREVAARIELAMRDPRRPIRDAEEAYLGGRVEVGAIAALLALVDSVSSLVEEVRGLRAELAERHA